MTKISAVEKGRINKESYAAYIAELEATGKKFPTNNFGEVNLTAIAKACGFNRQVFSNNQAMRAALNEDIERIGTDISEGQPKETRPHKKASEKSKEGSRLHKELEARTNEIETLKAQILELNKRIAELEGGKHEMDLAFDELLASGRRYCL